jgi:hypothetical protein
MNDRSTELTERSLIMFAQLRKRAKEQFDGEVESMKFSVDGAYAKLI